MEFLDRMILDNSVKNLLIVGVIILLVLLFKRFLSHSVASLFFLGIKRRWPTIEKKEFIKLTIKPLSWFLVILICVFSLERLYFPRAWYFSIANVPAPEIARKVGASFMIASFFYFAVSMINFIALLLETHGNTQKDKSHGQVIIFFRDLLKVIVSIVGILFILRAAFNQNIGSLLTGLSIVGAALALAAKESIENIIASFIIFFDKPFYTGDTLKVNNVMGTVERIGLRSTRVRTADKTLVTVPNKQMVDSVVDNFSMRNQRRAEIKLALSEKTKSADIQKLIEDIKGCLDQKEDEVIKSSVFLSDYGKEGAVVTIEYFTQPFSKGEFDKLKQQINFRLMELIDEQKHEMSNSVNSTTIIHNDNPGAAKEQPIV